MCIPAAESVCPPTGSIQTHLLTGDRTKGPNLSPHSSSLFFEVAPFSDNERGPRDFETFENLLGDLNLRTKAVPRLVNEMLKKMLVREPSRRAMLDELLGHPDIAGMLDAFGLKGMKASRSEYPQRRNTRREHSALKRMTDVVLRCQDQLVLSLVVPPMPQNSVTRTILRVGVCALLIFALVIVSDVAFFIALIVIYEYFVFTNGNRI
jgi:hypothetical protein